LKKQKVFDISHYSVTANKIGEVRLGYRPTEVRVEKEMKKLINEYKGKLVFISLNLDRDVITFGISDEI
jgi:hypothetical protein